MLQSSGNFAIPQGGYPAPYVPADFQGLYLSQPEAPGILTCGYHNMSLGDHPLHCHGHSYTEGSVRVRMYPSRLGLVDTGGGYTEKVHKVRRGVTKFYTVIRMYNNLFGQTSYQAAAVEIWGGLHFLPLIMSVLLSHHEKSSFVNQLDSRVFGFDKIKGMSPDAPIGGDSMSPSDPYQAYVIAL